jgi:CBS domain-containing protein
VYTRKEEAKMKTTQKDNTAEGNLNSDGLKTGSESPTTVGDVMTRHVITMSPHQSFSDAISLMANHSFRHFLVVDTANQLLGVVSDRDILRRLARTANFEGTSVSQLMSRDPITVTPDTRLSHAVGKMLSKRINCLPVVDDTKNLCGIITSTDLLKAFRSLQESAEQKRNL